MDANVTDLRIVKTRTNIKNSLIDLLAEKNVSKITVTELAEKAMINRKTFYRHYHTVQDVVDDINYDIVNGCAESSEKLADAVNEFVLGALSEYVRPKS